MLIRRNISMFSCVRRVTVHPLFFLCLAWIVLTGSTLELLCVMFSVFLHECGHIFVYSKAHVVIDEIYLQPFGVRITLRDEVQIRTSVQLICAIAGPFMNFVFAGIMFILSNFITMPGLCSMFFVTNLFLGGFNLLPIMPLDGGCILEITLCAIVGEYISRVICAWVSLLVATGLLMCGIYVVIDSGINISVCVLAGYICICLAVKIYNSLKKRISNVKSKH